MSNTTFTQQLRAVVTSDNKDAIQSLAKRHDCPLYVVISTAFEHDLDLLSDDPRIGELIDEAAQADRERNARTVAEVRARVERRADR